MARARHPFLAQAEVPHDPLLDAQVGANGVGFVDGPWLVKPPGEDTCVGDYLLGGRPTPLCEDAPARLEDALHQAFAEKGFHGPTAWRRLRNLVHQLLLVDPDNPLVREDAWLVGLTDDMPPAFRSRLDRLARLVADILRYREREGELAARAMATGTRQWLTRLFTHDCHQGLADCPGDVAVVYVLPDGRHHAEFTCRRRVP